MLRKFDNVAVRTWLADRNMVSRDLAELCNLSQPHIKIALTRGAAGPLTIIRMEQVLGKDLVGASDQYVPANSQPRLCTGCRKELRARKQAAEN